MPIETASILVPDVDGDAVLAALERQHLVDGAAERHTNGLLYFRLPPPAQVAWHDELERLTGELEPDPGDLWVTHPFECWIAGPLAFADKARAHASLPALVADSTGAPVDTRGVELRTQPANAPYLLLALQKAGFARPLVRILD